MIALFALSAFAGGLDLPETGGQWGSPTATDSTAVYWNPAGLAAGDGTQFTIEIAPTSANVEFVRDDPFFGGKENYAFSGIVPFVGVSSDLTIPDLGVGLGLAVPVARGATSPADLNGGTDADGDGLTDHGPGAYALREGGVQTITASLAASYDIKKVVSIGIGGHLLISEYDADLNNETLTSLRDGLCEQEGYCNWYTEPQSTDPFPRGFNDANALVEDPGYAARVHFTDLRDTAITFSTGVNVHPNDFISVGLAYMQGARVDHTGPAKLELGCPNNEQDLLGRIASGSAGLCNNTVTGTGGVGFNLPARLHGGVRLHPLEEREALQLELMGGWVGYSVFTDFDIDVKVKPEGIPNPDGIPQEDIDHSAHELSQTRKWARDSTDSSWVAGDVKGRFLKDNMLLLGARATYDRGTVPDTALSPNNYDADTTILGALAAVRPIDKLELGLSFSHHFVAPRSSTKSDYEVVIDPAQAKPDRYNWPQMRGSYNSSINRIGISLRGHLGQKGD